MGTRVSGGRGKMGGVRGEGGGVEAPVDLVDQCVPNLNVAHAGHIVVDVQLGFLRAAKRHTDPHSEH